MKKTATMVSQPLWMRAWWKSLSTRFWVTVLIFTVKLCETIFGRMVIILVDSGCTHNFISFKLVAKLKLPTLVIPTFGITINNKDIIPCHQICPEVTIRMLGLIIKQDFSPFHLSNADLLLGIT